MALPAIYELWNLGWYIKRQLSTNWTIPANPTSVTKLGAFLKVHDDKVTSKVAQMRDEFLG